MLLNFYRYKILFKNPSQRSINNKYVINFNLKSYKTFFVINKHNFLIKKFTKTLIPITFFSIFSYPIITFFYFYMKLNFFYFYMKFFYYNFFMKQFISQQSIKFNIQNTNFYKFLY
uniref:Uncharacterized protein n=1 Tax=Strombidium sp. TaxID=181122 RepID=A0A7T0M4K8_9SPIT|nr:hypothetical protein [Strombidium sp.]